MALIQSLHRPARLLSVALAVGFLLLWFAYLRYLSPVCNFPVLLRNVTSDAAAEGADQSAPPLVLPPVRDNRDQQQPLATPQAKIAKVTVATNKLDSPLIDRALRTHEVQNELHGYLHYIAQSQVVSNLIENDTKRRPEGAWTKPAFMMSIIVAELQKPEEERLEWLFWFDADTIVTNPLTPLEVFLPDDSDPNLRNINLLMASNWDGLNSGAFALRVHPWSVSLLSAVLGYPVYKAANLKTDRFRDQSAFQWLLTKPDSPIVTSTPLKGREFWAEIPIRWFNSLPVNNAFNKTGAWIFANNMTEETFDKGTSEVYVDGKGPKVQRWKVMQGDMVVHFAGTNRVRDSWMGPWLDRADALLPEWANISTQDVLREEAKAYWDRQARHLADSKGAVKIVTVVAEPPAPPAPPALPTTTTTSTTTTPKPAAAAATAGVRVANDGPALVLTEAKIPPAQVSGREELLVDTASPPRGPAA